MTTTLSIGDFSRMTQLSVETLRHYHEVGLLEPARVDPFTGYRIHSPEQVPPLRSCAGSGTSACPSPTSVQC